MQTPLNVVTLSEARLLSRDELQMVDIVITDSPIDEDISLSPHTIVADSDSKETRSRLLRHPGYDFIDKIGHATVNMWGPMYDRSVLPDKLVNQRIDRGVLFGKHVNTIGHLLRKDRRISAERTDAVTLLDIIETKSAAAGIAPKVMRKVQASTHSVATELLSIIADEIVNNWAHHSSGNETISIDFDENEVLFTISNRCNIPLPTRGLTSLIRRPFVRWGKADTSGLGYFIISLISSDGVMEWDTQYKDGLFSLTLSFC